jgi:hypothetical protein
MAQRRHIVYRHRWWWSNWRKDKRGEEVGQKKGYPHQ